MSPGQSTSGAKGPHEIATTNSTSTLFLGSRTKSWMVAVSGSNQHGSQSPMKAVKPSRLRVNAPSATNSVSSTQSKVTREDWSSSTSGEGSMRASDAEAELATEPQSASIRTASEGQSAPVASQTEASDIPHGSNAETRRNLSKTTRQDIHSSVFPSHALHQTQITSLAPPPSNTLSDTEGVPQLEASPIIISPSEPTSQTVQDTTGRDKAGRPAIPPLVTRTSRQPNQNHMNPALSGLRPRLSYGVGLYNQAELIRRADGQSDLDVARIKILIEACEMQDSDALLLHQIYMIYSLKQPTTGLLVLTESAFTQAFGILQYILGNNDALTPSLAKHLLDFPTPWMELYQPTFQSHIQRIRLTLNQLAGRWDQGLRACISRGFPLSPLEIQATFNLTSRRMQIAIFTALLHRMGILPGESHGSAAVRAFTDFQQKSSPASSIPDINFTEWRQVYDRTMQGNPASAMNPRSNSMNGMSPAQTSPPNPSFVSSATMYHAQGYQGQGGDVSAPNTVHGPPFVPRSHDTGTDRAMSSPWQPANVGVTHSNHFQQAAPQEQRQPPISDLHVRQYHGPVHQTQRQQQASQAGSIQQRHVSMVQGTFNQSLSAPQMGTFTRRQEHSRTVLPSQGPRINTRNQSGVVQAPSPVPQQTRLLPPPGWSIPQAVHPNPDRIALHQAHLRSPIARIVDLNNKPTPDLRLYQVVTKLVISPQRLDETTRFMTLRLDIPRAEIDRKLIHAPPPHPSLVTGSQLFKPSALRWRLKCIARPIKDNTTPIETEFCASSTTWPEHLFASFNQLDDIVLRRKTHYGRDLASDLTDSVVAGPNTLAISFDPVSTDKRYQKAFFLAVERVELFAHEHILANLKTIPRLDALASILKAMKGNPTSSPSTTNADNVNDADNDELTITNPTISIDVTDPFTSLLWQTPVRTRTCKHRECFDLTTFLSSRPKSQLAGPAGADDWKCPHCQRDARPGQLVVDGFLESVRTELVAKGMGGVKAVLVREDGSWEAKGNASADEARQKGGSATPGTPGGDPDVDGGVRLEGGNGEAGRAASVSTSADVVMVLDDDDDDDDD